MRIAIDDRTVLDIDPALEAERYARFLPLLKAYGFCKKGNPFPQYYPKYPPTSRCYDSAISLACLAGLTYCEGVVFFETDSGHHVLAHGWCYDSDTADIVDPTLSKMQHRKDIKYFGVPVKKSYVLKEESECRYFGLLDGRRDGAKKGIYFDKTSDWLESIPTLELNSAMPPVPSQELQLASSTASRGGDYRTPLAY